MPRREHSSDYFQESFLPELEGGHTSEPTRLRRLHEGLAPYLDTRELRRIVADYGDIYAALRRPDVPREVRDLLDTLYAILHPRPREQIRSPTEIAALFMVEMAQLDHEEFRT